MGISPKRIRGTGFEVEEMMKLFLVIIIGLAVVILIIAVSGGLSSLLTEFCAKNPTICGGEDPNSKANYETAKASVDALVCAINSVAKGKDLCSTVLASTGSSTTTQAIGRNFGLTGFAIGDQQPSAKCEEKSTVTKTRTVSAAFYATDASSADAVCKQSYCGNDATCTANDLKSSSLTFERIRPKGTLLECTCETTMGSAQRQTVYGIDRHHAHRACMDLFPSFANNIYLYDCKENTDQAKYDSMINFWVGPSGHAIFGMKDVQLNAKKYECTFSGDKGEERYFVYGIGAGADAQARKACENDVLYSTKYYTINKLTSYQISAPQEVAGLFLATDFSMAEETKYTLNSQYQCQTTTTSKSFTCAVNNFRLPQKVQEAWIWSYGDPQFLAYWQVFPMDQNTWTFKTDWKLFAAIAVVSAIPPTRVAGAMVKIGFKGAWEGAKKISALQAEKMLAKEIGDIAVKRFTEKPVTVLVKGAALSGAALAVEYADSTRANYQPNKNSVILKSPYQNKETFPLVDNLERKPVLIQWKPGLITSTQTVSAHLVSPCSIQSMSIEMAVAECNDYVFNTNTGIISCIGSSVNQQSSLPLCQIENYLEITNNAGLPEENLINMVRIKQMDTNQIASYFFGQKWEEYKQNKLKECPEELDRDILHRLDDALAVSIGGKEYWITACKEDEDETIDRIEVREKQLIAGFSGYKREVLLDYDRDGHFESYALKNCQVDAVVIKDIKKASVKSNEHNYCFDETGNFPAVLKVAGIAAGIGGMIAAGFFTGGTGWAVLIGSGIASASLSGAGEYKEYMGKWPGTTGG